MTLINSASIRLFLFTIAVIIIPKSLLFSQALQIDQVNSQSILIVETFFKNGKVGIGTGLLLWNYIHEDSVYMLTAHHVLKNADSITLYISDTEKTQHLLTLGSFNLEDSLSSKLYMTYTTSDGRLADISLFPIDKKTLSQSQHKFKVLSRSFCAFDDSVYVGDHVLIFGYADMSVFDFVSKGDPLAVSAVIAHKGSQSYLVDRKTHKGMSGGIAFKEYPKLGQFSYKAVGLVSSGMSKDSDYSWIVKLNYIDSILLDNDGQPWSAPDE